MPDEYLHNALTSKLDLDDAGLSELEAVIQFMNIPEAERKKLMPTIKAKFKALWRLG